VGCEKANEKGGDAPEHGEKPCRGKEEGKIKNEWEVMRKNECKG